MNINTKNTQDNKKQDIYASSFRRSLASMIDIWIVLFLRIFVAQILATFWLRKAAEDFQNDFKAQFGTEFIKNTPEHIEFLINSDLFTYGLIFYAIIIMIGAIYHAYLNSSAWCATVGKRIAKIMIIKEDDNPIKLGKGFFHYFLSVLPFAYILFLLTFQLKHKLNFYQAVTSNDIILFFGIVFVFWVQLHLFTKRKTTAYDLICKTVIINGKTSSKFPWSK